MHKLTGSLTKLGGPKALAVFFAVLAPACSTDFADQPLVVGDPNTQGLGTSNGSMLALDGTGQAGFFLATELDRADQTMRLLVDGLYLTSSDSPPYEYLRVSSQGGFGTLAVNPFPTVGGHQVPGGFPAGTHTLTLEREDGSVLASTTQDFAAGAWNNMVVYGSWTQPVVDFFSDAVPADPDARLIRVLNITTAKQVLTISVCIGSAPCAVSDLAYGESWVATLAATDPDPTIVFSDGTSIFPLNTTLPQNPQDFFYAILSPTERMDGTGHY